MAIVTIKGIVMETFEQNACGREEAIKLQMENKPVPQRKCARIFQKGEKNLLEVKGVNGEAEGDLVELTCRAVAWAFNGKGGLSLTVVDEE